MVVQLYHQNTNTIIKRQTLDPSIHLISVANNYTPKCPLPLPAYANADYHVSCVGAEKFSCIYLLRIVHMTCGQSL